MTYWRTFIAGLLGGVFASVGGLSFIYLMALTGSRLISASVFAFGIVLTCIFSAAAFLPSAGRIIERGNKYIFHLLFVLAGNIISATMLGFILYYLSKSLTGWQALNLEAETLINIKMQIPLWETILLAFLCGPVLGAGVYGYNKIKNPLLRIIVVYVSGVVYATFGLFNLTTEFFYYAIGGAEIYSLGQSLINLTLIIIGNVLGSLAIYYILHRVRPRADQPALLSNLLKHRKH